MEDRQPLAGPIVPLKRVAALYDIHGNLPALLAVGEEVRRAQAEAIVVGGDVLPGLMPGETLDFLAGLELPVRFIMGNGDRAVLEAALDARTARIPEQARAVIEWTAKKLTLEQIREIASWPATLSLEIEGLGEVFFCHATPRNDTDVFTSATPEGRLLSVFEHVHADVVVCGHTHVQFDRSVGKTRVVNAGSVGMPYGEAGAYWLMLGPEIGSRRTWYDFSKAAERIRMTDYPQAADFADNNILKPPSEAEMLAVFSRMELQ